MYYYINFGGLTKHIYIWDISHYFSQKNKEPPGIHQSSEFAPHAPPHAAHVAAPAASWAAARSASAARAAARSAVAQLSQK